YGLTNTIPQAIDIAIYKKDKIRSHPKWPIIDTYYYSYDRYHTGIKKIKVNNDFFHIYNIDKTVVDIVYYREKIGIEETKEIITNYLSTPEKNLNNFINYAKTLGCYEVIKTYMEILL
ncbi:MAG: hypothetical protein MR210_04300, partial [Erysipelotrichaceae bacterium]|nr:hypothetical protein [Erysipelotrichaceae bacterium]